MYRGKTIYKKRLYSFQSKVDAYYFAALFSVIVRPFSEYDTEFTVLI